MCDGSGGDGVSDRNGGSENGRGQSYCCNCMSCGGSDGGSSGDGSGSK